VCLVRGATGERVPAAVMSSSAVATSAVKCRQCDDIGAHDHDWPASDNHSTANLKLT
jgi:hypothetical protein